MPPLSVLITRSYRSLLLRGFLLCFDFLPPQSGRPRHFCSGRCGPLLSFGGRFSAQEFHRFSHGRQLLLCLFHLARPFLFFCLQRSNEVVFQRLPTICNRSKKFVSFQSVSIVLYEINNLSHPEKVGRTVVPPVFLFDEPFVKKTRVWCGTDLPHFRRNA